MGDPKKNDGTTNTQTPNQVPNAEPQRWRRRENRKQTTQPWRLLTTKFK